MRARVKTALAAGVLTLGVAGAPFVPAASANSTHTCQGHNNCNTGGGGGGGGSTSTLQCSNKSGTAFIIVQANVCPQNFPILVDVL